MQLCIYIVYICTCIRLTQAVGEPPLFLAASVFFAIKDAIAAARTERGEDGPFRLDTPATCERIRMACVDQFTKQVYILHQEFDKKFSCTHQKGCTYNTLVSLYRCVLLLMPMLRGGQLKRKKFNTEA